MAAEPVRLTGDCLDSRVIDRAGRVIGRVDGIVLEHDDDGIRVVALELGAVALGRRLHPRVGRLVKRIVAHLRRSAADPYRVPWHEVRVENGDCHASIDGAASPTLALERFLRERLIGRLWGA